MLCKGTGSISKSRSMSLGLEMLFGIDKVGNIEPRRVAFGREVVPGTACIETDILFHCITTEHLPGPQTCSSGKTEIEYKAKRFPGGSSQCACICSYRKWTRRGGKNRPTAHIPTVGANGFACINLSRNWCVMWIPMQARILQGFSWKRE